MVYRGSLGDFGSSRIIFGEYSDFGQSSRTLNRFELTKNRLLKIPAEFWIPGFPAYLFCTAMSSKYEDFRIRFCRQRGEKSQLVLSQAKEYPYLNSYLFTLQNIAISTKPNLMKTYLCGDRNGKEICYRMSV